MAIYTDNASLFSSVVFETSWLWLLPIFLQSDVVRYAQREGRGIFVSPRRSPSPDGTTVLPEHPLEVLYRSPSADGPAILNEKGVAFISPRRSSSPDGTAVLPEHPLEVLCRSPSADGTAILTEEELDWLQSGVVFPRAPPPQKRRSSVSWRQVKRRECRVARKFGVPAFATLHR